MSDNSFTIVFADGRRETVSPRLADTVAYSLTWKRNKWPSPTEDQLLAGVFTAFAAARREGKFTGTFDQFQTDVITVEEIDGEDAEDPSQPAPAPADPAPADPAPAGFDAMPAAPPAMSPMDPAPIVSAESSPTSPQSVTTIPLGSSRHSR